MLREATSDDKDLLEQILNHERYRENIGGPFDIDEIMAKSVIFLWKSHGVFLFEPRTPKFWRMSVVFLPKSKDAYEAEPYLRDELKKRGVKGVMGIHKLSNRASTLGVRKFGGHKLFIANGNYHWGLMLWSNQ